MTGPSDECGAFVAHEDPRGRLRKWKAIDEARDLEAKSTPDFETLYMHVRAKPITSTRKTNDLEEIFMPLVVCAGMAIGVFAFLFLVGGKA